MKQLIVHLASVNNALLADPKFVDDAMFYITLFLILLVISVCAYAIFIEVIKFRKGTFED